MPLAAQIIPNLSAQSQLFFPSWLRVEPRARSDDFSRALAMPFADPLWNIARQGQFGELQAEDAGSPIRVSVSYRTEKINEVQLGASGLPTSLDGAPPLEALVEREPISFDWRTRVQIGQQLERFLHTELGDQATETIKAIRRRFPILRPSGDQLTELDRSTQRFLRLMAGRVIDGGTLFDVVEPGIEPPPIPAGLVIANENGVRTALQRLVGWLAALYSQPTQSEGSAWIPERLQYQFKVHANSDDGPKTTLVAPSYRSGELDWYTMSVGALPQGDTNAGSTETQEFLPTQVSFYGQPETILYEFEDKQTDFGNLDVATTDLAKLMLMEFAFVYGDDWLIIPLPLPVGSLTRIQSLIVTDVFGVSTTIPRASSSGDGPLHRWELFGLSSVGDPSGPAIGDLLFLPPAVGFREESSPIEEVRFMRDEDANMVWAILHTVRNGLGEPMGGFEWYTEAKGLVKEGAVRARLESMRGLIARLNEINEQLAAATISGGGTVQALETEAQAIQEQLNELSGTLASAEASGESPETIAADESGLPQYQLATTVPPNWIPYVPVRMTTGDPSIKLRRAEILRPDDAMGIDVMTQILGPNGAGQGLEWVNEESVSRAGVKIQLTKQRVRWVDGKTYAWTGMKVLTGRGGGTSGLTFDVVRGGA